MLCLTSLVRNDECGWCKDDNPRYTRLKNPSKYGSKNIFLLEIGQNTDKYIVTICGFYFLYTLLLFRTSGRDSGSLVYKKIVVVFGDPALAFFDGIPNVSFPLHFRLHFSHLFIIVSHVREQRRNLVAVRHRELENIGFIRYWFELYCPSARGVLRDLRAELDNIQRQKAENEAEKVCSNNGGRKKIHVINLIQLDSIRIESVISYLSLI